MDRQHEIMECSCRRSTSIAFKLTSTYHKLIRGVLNLATCESLKIPCGDQRGKDSVRRLSHSVLDAQHHGSARRNTRKMRCWHYLARRKRGGWGKNACAPKQDLLESDRNSVSACLDIAQRNRNGGVLPSNVPKSSFL